MDATTDCGKDLRGVLARWARIPLVMYESADRVDEEALPGGLGLRTARHGAQVAQVSGGLASRATSLVDGGMTS